MNQEEFTQLVYEMRQAQKEYFKMRTKTALEKSKRLEAEVDQAILNQTSQQLSLL